MMTETGDTEKALQVAVTEVGLSLMDLDGIHRFLLQTNAPNFMIATLTSIMNQLYAAGAALDSTKAGLARAVEQRDEMVQALVHAQCEIEALKQAPDESAEQLAILEYDLSIANMNNPLIAVLVREVWEQSQADLIAQKGA
jgi:hypothetical protein